MLTNKNTFPNISYHKISIWEIDRSNICAYMLIPITQMFYKQAIYLSFGLDLEGKRKKI